MEKRNTFPLIYNKKRFYLLFLKFIYFHFIWGPLHFEIISQQMKEFPFLPQEYLRWSTSGFCADIVGTLPRAAGLIGLHRNKYSG